MDEFRPYLESRWLPDFDEYVACIDEYERRSAVDAASAPSRSASGGTMVRDIEFAGGLSDSLTRQRYLDSDGIAGEVIFPQGSVPFAPYPAVATPGGGMEFSASAELRNLGPTAYNRWLAEFCSHQPPRHAGVAIVPIRDIDESVATVQAPARSRIVRRDLAASTHRAGHRFVQRPMLRPVVGVLSGPRHDGEHARRRAPELWLGSGDATALVLAETDWFSHRALWFLIFAGVFERFPRLHASR